MAFTGAPFLTGRLLQGRRKSVHSHLHGTRRYVAPVCRFVRVSVPVQVEAPRTLVYETFSDLERMGEWSTCLETVKRDDENGEFSEWKFRWRGVRLSWRAQDGERRSDEVIAWKSVSGLKHVGSVTFEKSGEGTKVTMDVEYDLASMFASVAETPAVSGFVQRALEEELKRFRQYTLRMYRRQLIAGEKASA